MAAIVAVGSVPLGETPKKPSTEEAGVTYLSPASPLKDSFNPETGLKETLPTFHPSALFPAAGGSQWGAGPPATIFPVSGKWSLREHDPLTAYVYDPGFTLPTPAPPPEPLVHAAEGPHLDAAAVAEILVATGWPAEWRADALTVSFCESGYRIPGTLEQRWKPGAVGDGGNSLGLFQLWTGWFTKAGYSLEEWADPYVNSRVALYVRETRGRFGGKGGWTCADLRGVY